MCPKLPHFNEYVYFQGYMCTKGITFLRIGVRKFVLMHFLQIKNNKKSKKISWAFKSEKFIKKHHFHWTFYAISYLCCKSKIRLGKFHALLICRKCILKIYEKTSSTFHLDLLWIIALLKIIQHVKLYYNSS